MKRRHHGLKDTSCALLLLLAAAVANCSPPSAQGATESAQLAAPRNATQADVKRANNAATQKRRNVILMLSDGTAPEAWTLARWVKGQPLAVDSILVGALRTYGADSIITDSAPGATAYATGHKGTDKAISVGPFHETIDAAKATHAPAYVPLPTLLEGAHFKGFATGLVATSNVQHATPAAFSAHVRDRNLFNEIAKQQVYQGIDVVFGGGRDYLVPTSVPGGKRTDGEDLLKVLRSLGYEIAETSSALKKAPAGRIFGLFAPDDMAFEIDRNRDSKSQPSLAEMTENAIRRLSLLPSGKDKGFFLFVEGSKVDWAAHDNDPVGVVSELLAFDDAVAKAITFAQSNDHTQVIVVADHATGGLSIGTGADPHYSQTDDDAVWGPLRKAKMSAKALSQRLAELGPKGPVEATILSAWGIGDLDRTELAELAQKLTDKQNLIPVLSRIISTRAKVGWTTHGHTGADPYLFAYGPEHPQGLQENTAICNAIARYLDIPLAELQQTLFTDLGAAFSSAGYSVSIDAPTASSGQLLLSRGSEHIALPFSKNLLLVNGKSLTLPGIVVYADKLSRVYGPARAVDLLKQTNN